MKVKVKALDINMEPFTMEGEELMARAMQHEIDHLDGNMYMKLVEGEIYDNSELFGDEDEEEDE
ncbi:MAG: peptide deformylase, partial [Lachnospiraceae bacterium]|nr:peptide deformylase [Lachnospiraceae bacterium]